MGDLGYQLRILQDQHAELQAAVRAKDAELKELREVAAAATELQAQDVQAAKIIDLSKKNRALLLALEKEKARSAKLQADLKAAGGGSGGAAGGGAGGGLDPEAVEDIARSMVEQAAEAAEAAAKEASMWKERHQQQTNKVAQVEQKAFALEIENRRLARALQREVGDDVPLAKVLEEGSDWKGRREQIIALRDQVRALRAAQGLVPEGKREAAAKAAISKISGARSAEMDRLAAELAASRAECDTLRAKFEAAVSRRKVLENELGSMREKVAIVLDKTQNDDRLIAALRAELLAARQAVPRAPSRGPGGLASEDELWQELGTLRRRATEQEAQIDRQEQIILGLQQRLAAAPSGPGSAGSERAGLRPGSSGQGGGGPPSRGGERGGGGPGGGGDAQAMEQQLKLVEVENGRLQELVRLLQAKLEAALDS